MRPCLPAKSHRAHVLLFNSLRNQPGILKRKRLFVWGGGCLLVDKVHVIQAGLELSILQKLSLNF